MTIMPISWLRDRLNCLGWWRVVLGGLSGKVYVNNNTTNKIFMSVQALQIITLYYIWIIL